MQVRNRSEVAVGDTWDLSALYPDPNSWNTDFASLEKDIPKAKEFVGKLGTSAQVLVQAIELQLSQNRLLERLYVFAHLRNDEDTTNSTHLGIYDRASSLASRFSEAWSYFTPELLSLPDERLAELISSPEAKPYERMLQEITRYKPHTLSTSEELLLAGASEVFSAAERAFSQLNNADLSFGNLEVEGKEQALTHGSYVLFLKNQDRTVREAAFERYYSVFNSHRHTIASTLASSIKRDIFVARTRNHKSALERSLFADNVAPTVYNNLISTVHASLAPLHQYYETRKDLLSLPELRIYDTYLPLVADVETDIPYEEAAELIVEALAPLGEQYQQTLRKGFFEARWVDRYENKGKRSGAYSSGCYDSPPYMLMNYKQKSLNDVFTLAHEAGHSMHTFYSSKHQPYQDSGYTIFVAEVASTFNEQLLLERLRTKFKGNPKMEAFLVNHQIDEIKSTLYRQTMFAEFERETHAAAERHEPLTGDVFRAQYRDLLQRYFGKAVTLGELDDLECFRIPHFYHAFYVYKYATGISAAIALARMVLEGGEHERKQYLTFLQSGGSKFPLELLKDAGVDLTTPEPISSALSLFATRVEELNKILKGN